MYPSSIARAFSAGFSPTCKTVPAELPCSKHARPRGSADEGAFAGCSAFYRRRAPNGTARQMASPSDRRTADPSRTPEPAPMWESFIRVTWTTSYHKRVGPDVEASVWQPLTAQEDCVILHGQGEVSERFKDPVLKTGGR